MDLHLLHKVNLMNRKKENMTQSQQLLVDNMDITDETEDPFVSFSLFICKILIASFAAYLSWTSSGNFSTPVRVLFASGAFMFGGLYILLFLIFRSDVYDFSKLRSTIQQVKL
jgi:hypothetical protein